jgi:hypothetical protein
LKFNIGLLSFDYTSPRLCSFVLTTGICLFICVSTIQFSSLLIHMLRFFRSALSPLFREHFDAQHVEVFFFFFISSSSSSMFVVWLIIRYIIFITSVISLIKNTRGSMLNSKQRSTQICECISIFVGSLCCQYSSVKLGWLTGVVDSFQGHR